MNSVIEKACVTAILSICLLTAASSQAGELSPGLAKSADLLASGPASDSLVTVVVFLDDSDLKQNVMKSAHSTGFTRAQRNKAVLAQLKQYDSSNKRNLRQYLSAHSTSPVIEHWIVPAMTVTLPLSDVTEVSELDGVRLVVENAALVYEEPVKITPDLSTSTAAVSSQLALLKVPELWKRGLKGKGRLVCSFDTGVLQGHVALADKWRGNHVPLTSAWFSKVAPEAVPYDLIGHGTHTMGVMVGAAEADSFGVAPEAEWITAGVIDQGRTLSMTLSDIIEAFQWAANPDRDDNTSDDVPDVILNSWGIPKGLFSPCDDTFWGMIDYVEAAGIVTIFSAGNEGPEPMTLRSPADRASTPINSFAVGAVDNSLVIGSFSSRGPSSCDPTQIKPEVVAPGVSIRSSYKDGGYTLMTGTSMAAPYIAGLVALVRQYNPNATVEQIKYAFIQAAQDLGDGGNDNAYGHGFVDASKVLDYIDPPTVEGIHIESIQIAGDGIADPGEQFELSVTLANSDGDIELMVGHVVPIEPGLVEVITGQSEFYFGSSTSAVNQTAFDLALDSSLFNGQVVAFKLLLSSDGAFVFDSLEFDVTVGIPPRGSIATHENSRMRLSVSDFGQFGFAPGSMYNAMGDGFCLDGSDNLLYEAGLVVGVGEAQISTSIRNSDGMFKQSDFVPVVSLSEEWEGPDGGIHRTGTFHDITGSVPVNVTQETIHYSDEGFVLVRYTIENRSSERLTGLNLGLFVDLDLSDSDIISVDESMDLVYQRGANGLLAGVVGLQNSSNIHALSNGDSKSGYTDEELFALISSSSSAQDSDQAGDAMFLMGSNSLVIEPLRTVRVSFAMVGGRDLQELYANAESAKDKFVLTSGFDEDVDEGQASKFRLYQNYPNPFNPITTISFAVVEAGDFQLEVFNILGQKVTTLHSGYLDTGLHQFEWHSTDDRGATVANGVYFYRLQGQGSSFSRKMLLVK